MSFISSESDRTNDSSSYDESEDSIQLFENDEQKLISKDDIDQPDSVLPVEVTFARHHLGEDLGDALWNTKLRVTKYANCNINAKYAEQASLVLWDRLC
jgi:hypothetical protein